jgi:hypothetical protein
MIMHQMLNLKSARGILMLLSPLLCPLILHAQKQEPYIIHFRSAHVSSLDIAKHKKSLSRNITINLTSENAGAAYSETPPAGTLAKWASIPPPQITNITVMDGFYTTLQKGNENTRSNTTVLSQVTFPLRLKIEISDQSLDIEFPEAGDWTIKITLDNIYNPDRLSPPLN